MTNLYLFIFNKINFLQVFRNNFEKGILLFYLPYLLLFGLSLLSLIQSRYKFLTYFILSLYISTNSYLFFSSKIFLGDSYPYNNPSIGYKISVPNYYLQSSNLINSDPDALNTLKELSDALGNYANYASTIQTQISAKRNISDSYNKSDVDSIFNTNKQTIYTANVNFLDVANLGINTLTIKGGQYIRLINNVNQALMDLDNSQISIMPNLKLL